MDYWENIKAGLNDMIDKCRKRYEAHEGEIPDDWAYRSQMEIETGDKDKVAEIILRIGPKSIVDNEVSISADKVAHYINTLDEEHIEGFELNAKVDGNKVAVLLKSKDNIYGAEFKIDPNDPLTLSRLGWERYGDMVMNQYTPSMELRAHQAAMGADLLARDIDKWIDNLQELQRKSAENH